MSIEIEQKGKVSSVDDYESQGGRWHAEIETAEKAKGRFEKMADLAVERYKSEKAFSANIGSGYQDKSVFDFNVFWANIDTSLGQIMNKAPVPVVRRRYREKDQDPVANIAAIALERALGFHVEDPQSCFMQACKGLKFDLLVAGLGVVWQRVETERDIEVFEEVGPDGETSLLREESVIVNQTVKYEHVHYRDFLCSSAKSWDDVRWVARKIYYTKDTIKRSFSEIDLDKLGGAYREDHDGDSVFNKKGGGDDHYETYCVYEIWDKPSKKVLWYCEDYDGKIIAHQDDPWGLQGFFPCPPPITATTTTDSIWPYPDYHYIRDLVALLDSVSTRVADLVEKIQVKGVCDASIPELQNLFEDAREMDVIGVENWQSFASSGGFRGAIDFLPIEAMAQVLNILIGIQENILQKIYEITGISDIMRGVSKASETLGAQQIKAQSAMGRFSVKQRGLQEYLAEVLQISGELICEHFNSQIIGKMVGMAALPQDLRQHFMDAIEMIREDGAREYRLEIETNSTITPNEEEDQQRRAQFLHAIGQFFKMSTEMMMMAPQMAPIMGRLVNYASQGFGVSKFFESDIEGVFKAIEEQLKQKSQQPTTEEKKMQAEAQARKEEMAMEQQKMQMEAQFKAQEAQMEARIEQAKAQMESQMEVQKAKEEMEVKAEAARQEMLLKEAEFRQEMAQDRAQFEQEMRQQAQKFAMELETLKTKTQSLPKEKGGKDN